MNQEHIEILAQSFFEQMQAENAGNPIILLVHDEPLARNALHELGVENSNWNSGIASLLRSTVNEIRLFECHLYSHRAEVGT